LVLEEGEEEAVGAEAEVFAEVGNGAGSDYEGQTDLRRLASVLTVERLYHIEQVFLVFKQHVPIAVHL